MENTGGQAFPYDSREARTFAGMTLRDYFAGQALTGLITHHQCYESSEKTACWAYEFADAMIKERNQ